MPLIAPFDQETFCAVLVDPRTRCVSFYARVGLVYTSLCIVSGIYSIDNVVALTGDSHIYWTSEYNLEATLQGSNDISTLKRPPPTSDKRITIVKIGNLKNQLCRRVDGAARAVIMI